MNRVRVLAAIAIALASDGVEKDASGVPSAFRIWKPGVNVTDHGAHTFSEKSARALMAEQATRGNLISIDVDHLSLNDKAPPESRKAVGWLRLETRHTADGPELWATHVVWTDAVRAGLTKDPPEWRYFSPAYDVDKTSGEIVSFLNLALTNNPATHHVTALSTRRIAANKGSAMKVEDIIAAMYGGDDDKKKEARDAIASMSEDDRVKCKEAIAAATKAAFGEEDKPADGDKEPKEETKASDTPADEKEKGETKESRKAAAATRKPAAAGDVAVLANLGDQDRRIKALEETNEKSARERIFASRPDLTENQKKFLAAKPIAEVESLLSTLVPPTVTAANAHLQPSVRPTQGGKDTTNVRAARLPATEHKELARRFGRGDRILPHWDGNEFVLPQITPAQARTILARHAKDYGRDASVPMRASRGELGIGTIGNFDMRAFDASMTDTLKKAQVQS